MINGEKETVIRKHKGGVQSKADDAIHSRVETETWRMTFSLVPFTFSSAFTRSHSLFPQPYQPQEAKKDYNKRASKVRLRTLGCMPDGRMNASVAACRPQPLVCNKQPPGRALYVGQDQDHLLRPRAM